MSAHCSRFVQNAWKKELCSNCFKPREEHVEDTFKMNIVKSSVNLKSDNLKLQSILRSKITCQRDQRKKTVGFPESLTEIIGYGGDDFLSEGDEEDGGEYVESLNSEDETVPDSEEERALGNLTRANTNFNTITANLTETISADENGKASTTSSSKSFASLMLGRIQKDADGRKTTLLVSVTPFGGDEPLPTAKRPGDRKLPVNGFSSQPRYKPDDGVSPDARNEITLKSVKKVHAEPKKDVKLEKQQVDNPGLEKIVDMPLITSANLISVISRSESPDRNGCIDEPLENSQKTSDFVKTERKVTAISRTPAIKKADYEKPKVAVQSAQNGMKTEFESVAKMAMKIPEYSRLEKETVNAAERGIELTLTPLTKNDVENAAESDRPMIVRGKDVNKITVKSADSKKSSENEASPPLERKVEGESQSESESKRFKFEESRELAGEPDGKADEEEMAEPPALPRSSPPMDCRNSQQGESNGKISITNAEARAAFLHGGVSSNESKVKPVVPQKPTSFPGKMFLSKSTSSLDIAGVGKKMASNYALPPLSPTRSAQSTAIIAPQEASQSSNDKFDKAQINVLTPSIAKETTYVCQSPRLENPLAELRQSQSEMSEEGRVSEKSLSAPGRTEVASPTMTRDQPPDGGELSERQDSEEEISEVQPGVAAELIRSPNKRRMAPRPPATEILEDVVPASSLFARNPGANLKSDSPVVREKEKRERASSCSPKFREAVRESTDPVVAQSSESAPRRTISLSQDSLANPPEAKEEKKRTRSRFSLKRFLRMGSKKDVDMTAGHTGNSKIDEIPSTPQPKPRLEIIHPLELDGAAVEVLGNDRVTRIAEDQTDSAAFRIVGTKAVRSPSSGGLQAVRPGKPPPPPRNQSLEEWSRVDAANKPVRPPPPRTDAKLPPRSDKSLSKSTSSWQPSATSASSDSIYANLAAEDVTGEVRSALAPTKPQRTASMRDQAASQPVIKRHADKADNADNADNADTQCQDYELLVTLSPPTSDSPTSNDSHVYECLSSSPECDSNLELRHTGGSHLPSKRKSDSSAMEPAVEFKFHHQPFVRSTSLPYCGSETESELYAPYAFYAGDEGAEEDQDWKNKEDNLRISRLRQRRGRSIVHRSLEDNYGAVVVANHEALAQFVEQLNQAPQVLGCLRPLKNANPRLSDFKLDAGLALTIGKRIFYPATWNQQNVTICIAFDLAMRVSRKEFYLAPIVEFIDTVPKDIVGRTTLSINKDTEATISVLPRLQVSTIEAYGGSLRDLHDEGTTREACFVLLQFVSALKSLQARGIEDVPRTLSNVVLCREDKEACYRLYLLQGLNIETSEERDEERVSLCQCALIALQQLYLPSRLPVVQELLIREKAVTLSQVKSLLEFSLWGPADLTLGGSRDREITLQRWLDLERATVLHALVRTRAPLTVTDEYQLLFLVRTSAKIMCDASILLDEQRNRLARLS